MPINIRLADLQKPNVRCLAYLCEDEWELPTQLAALERWLKEKKERLPEEDIVADVGFQIRKDASGGGSALSCAFMASLAQARIALWLSEYPSGEFMTFGDEEPN